MSKLRDITMRSAAILATLCLALAITSCSRERQDWRSTQAADTIEAYDRFLSRHAESELADQARERIAQLTEERDWERASLADTANAYKQFLAQHPNGKWSQEARIRAESFALENLPAGTADSGEEESEGAATVSARPSPASLRTPAGTNTSSTPSGTSVAVAVPADLPEAVLADASDSSTTSPLPTSADSSAVTSAGAPASVPTPVDDVPQSSEQIPGATAGDFGYGIQLGAFSSEARATEEWERLEGRFDDQLGELEPRVVPATTSAGQLYRLQADVENEANARAICASLAKQSQGCVVVLPHH